MDPKPGHPPHDLQQLEVEHRQIGRRVERLQAALAAGSVADVRAGLQFLERYLVEHFAHEEAWMEERGYPGALEHARQHASLLATLGDARRALELIGSAVRAVHTIAAALDRHLAVDDAKLQRFHQARESLRRLAGLERRERRTPPPVRPARERMTPIPR
ncbi:MAG: hemerythrin family protein [Anaeromyxobacteraceae bacterium]